MYISILILPLIGSLIGNIRKNGIKGGPILSIKMLGIASIMALIAFYEVGIKGSVVRISLGDWLNLANIRIEWSFIFDSLTVTMFLPIILISFLIQIYSYEYLGSDPHKSRFFALLSLFSFSMILKVSAENLLILIFGWELIGIVSYLLVNFWFTRIAANKASLSALFINKIGDLSLILGIILCKTYYSDLSLSILFSLSTHIHEDLLFLIVLAILGAGAAKSALLGFHTWLPKAMEGPTSVSALLHSSTKVTAGVFLLIRISPILEYSSKNLMIILWLGSLGTILGAACALVNNDIKRIIAYSTLSQLGYKIVAIGISQYNLALFHLLKHAVFKSLLFLSSGAILHSLQDNQDIRKMGSLILHLPLSYLVFLFGSLSLMAFPFTAGFYSKDFLIELLIVPNFFSHTIAYFLTLTAALFTSLYSIRVFMIAIFSRPNYPLSYLPFIVDSGWFMTLPLLILSIGAVTLGYLSHDLFLGMGSTFYLNAIFTHPDHILLLNATNYPSLLAFIPLFFFLGFILLIPNEMKLDIIKGNIGKIGKIGKIGMNKKSYHKFTYMADFLNLFNVFNHWIMHNSLKLSVYIYRYFDKGLLEIFGPFGFFKFFHFIGLFIELFSSGYLLHYSYILIITKILLLISYFFIIKSVILLLIILLYISIVN